jgi:dynein intermediate chain, cytosolic
MIEFLNQEIQCEKGSKTLQKMGESSGEESDKDKDKAALILAESARRNTLQKTTVNGIPMINEFPSDGSPKKQSEQKEAQKEEIKPILSKAEADEVAESSEFKNFFSRASRLMERGLFSDIDVIGSFERLEIVEGETTTTKDQKIIEKCQFMKENPTKRAITNIEWSPKHKELFLCSYSSSENDWDPNETDGLVNIFSTQMPTVPELTLTCQSEITSCIFHPIDPFLVIGGTYSGNVIIWDMREKRNYPVSKTSTAASVMIKGISVVGSQNANNIVTVSNDGSI